MNGKTDWWAKSLPSEHDNLSSDLQSPCKARSDTGSLQSQCSGGQNMRQRQGNSTEATGQLDWGIQHKRKTTSDKVEDKALYLWLMTDPPMLTAPTCTHTHIHAVITGTEHHVRLISCYTCFSPYFVMLWNRNNCKRRKSLYNSFYLLHYRFWIRVSCKSPEMTGHWAKT